MPFVSLSWLGDHVELPSDATIAQVAQDLVAVGLEEEEIHPPSVTGPLVAGRVLTLEQETHKNGKTVNYCRVDVGQFNDEPGQGKEKSDLPSRGIICGAHNFEVGDTVVVCLPGAVLPGPFPISARKTYGHVSDGMICSLRELGLGEDHDGIIVLNQFLDGTPIPEPGTDLISTLGLGEEVLEINVTPDRGYCFSMRGVAREYSLSTGASFSDPGVEPALSMGVPPVSGEGFSVEVDDASACDRFVTLIVRGVDPHAPTPKWMVERLQEARMRPISLPVDITNYVMLDLGQPLHAYALEAVEAPFVVRRADAGEAFTTLDGQERILDAEDVVISDSPCGDRGSRVVGLAGVMGGLDSEISDSTVDIVIEGAHFDPVAIARTSRRHKLSSESSKRFERGVDPNVTAVAVTRVAQLLAEYGGGQVDDRRYTYDAVSPSDPIVMKVGEPKRLTGVDYDPERIEAILESIGAEVRREDDLFKVIPPSWRPDLTGPAHLVEEIARLDGYDKIPDSVPLAKPGDGLTASQWMRRRIADTAAQMGGVEVLSYPFIGDAHDRQMLSKEDDRRKAVRLRNPLADDAPLLRTSILDSLLDVANRNASRGNVVLSVFELGIVSNVEGVSLAANPGPQHPSDDVVDTLLKSVPNQPWHFAAVLGGPLGPSNVITPGRIWDWADSIAMAQRLGAAVGVDIQATRAWLPAETPRVPGPPVPKADEDPASVAPWHPGRAARMFVRKGKQIHVIGMAGELHPRVVEEFGLPARSCALEINLEALLDVLPADPVEATRVSVYPPAKIDLAVVVDKTMPAADVERVIRASAGQLLESIELFDIFRGEQVGEGNVSLAFALTLRAADRTLKPEEVTALRDKVIHDLEKRLGAQLRA